MISAMHPYKYIVKGSISHFVVVVWPSESMMPIVQSSLMGAGVARQSNYGRTHSRTVGALEGG